MTKPSEAAEAAASASRPRCPICAAVAPVFFGTGRDRFFAVASGSFPLLRCQACHCIFQHPLPDQETLAGYYPDAYWWSHGDEGGTEGPAPAPRERLRRSLRALEEHYRNFMVRDHGRYLVRAAARVNRRPTGQKLLDVGCGEGLFLKTARRRGFACHGLELSPHAAAMARARGLDVRTGEAGGEAWEGHRFDWVTLFHVLEHVAEPRRVLAWTVSLLEPGGSLIVQVPNVDSIQARIFRSRWYGLDVPRHLINFSATALTRLLVEAGFEILDLSHFSLRDNAPALVSSLFPGLDPMGRRVRAVSGAAPEPMLEFLYLGLVGLALPLAMVESFLGAGATCFVHARRP